MTGTFKLSITDHYEVVDGEERVAFKTYKIDCSENIKNDILKIYGIE